MHYTVLYSIHYTLLYTYKVLTFMSFTRKKDVAFCLYSNKVYTEHSYLFIVTYIFIVYILCNKSCICCKMIKPYVNHDL